MDPTAQDVRVQLRGGGRQATAAAGGEWRRGSPVNPI
jgi:hypothetical protein